MPVGPPAQPRKSPRQERARVTVDAILTATTQVLLNEGLDSVSTSRIAAVAGVSIGTLYQYFPNKESLLCGLFDAHLLRLRTAFAAEMPAVKDLPLAEAVA